ncbi:MAG: oxidative damage protection protein [Deltaproteobacteria bacterium]|nr:oxidative damage protection protein [Deltaproteobacteria bacterium]
MARMVQCAKLKKELPGLKYPPLKGELGKRIFETVSEDAWKMWLKHSTMVINEYRLNPSEPEGQRVLREQMQKFFFESGAEPPPEYVPAKRHH